MCFLSRNIAPQTSILFKLQLFHHAQVRPDHAATEDAYEIHGEPERLLLQLATDLDLNSSDEEPGDDVKEEEADQPGEDDQQPGEEPEDPPGSPSDEAEQEDQESDRERARSRKRRRSSTSRSRSRSRHRRRSVIVIDHDFDWKQLCGSNTIILSFF